MDGPCGWPSWMATIEGKYGLPLSVHVQWLLSPQPLYDDTHQHEHNFRIINRVDCLLGLWRSTMSLCKNQPKKLVRTPGSAGLYLDTSDLHRKTTGPSYWYVDKVELRTPHPSSGIATRKNAMYICDCYCCVENMHWIPANSHAWLPFASLIAFLPMVTQRQDTRWVF